jgi:cytoskeletal protein CcmA (bactofilin family)
MAFLRGRNEDGGMEPPAAVPSAPALAPAAPAPSRAPLSAFIDQGSEFEGKLTFRDTVRVDGCFRGEISSENTLVVGESGELFATVRSRNVFVAGAITGNVFARDRLVLQKTARLEGDVETGSLQVEEGAILRGRVQMNVPEAPRKSGGEPAGGKGERSA